MENQNQFNSWKNEVESVELNNQIDCLRIIELNISNVCNLKCSFCPQSYGWKQSNNCDFMIMNTIDVLKSQLDSFNYNGYICMAGLGEPTLNPNIIKILETLKDYKLVLVSNGLPLNKEQWEYINSLCQIKISVHNWDNIKWFEEKFENTNAWFRNHDVKNPQMNLYNRAGFLNIPQEIKTTKCNYPFYKIMIDTNGDYLQCEADWNHNSLSEHNLFNIDVKTYFETILNIPRENMLKENGRQNCKCCKNCDINGEMVGDMFVEFWKSNGL